MLQRHGEIGQDGVKVPSDGLEVVDEDAQALRQPRLIVPASLPEENNVLLNPNIPNSPRSRQSGCAGIAGFATFHRP
ncbi:hypothetical protein [Nitrosospira sp. Is2]|uniref:hypothetical protein n=1 Tax=Nitrosospira sp. Is2 TaxID=3080532 RepID=UPI000D4EFBAC|nr:hypothetical protein [Nitrosospira sp. Is2]PTR17539.1 hypothetical protein C8R31_101703 [Nitrosospira sp. Nsp2]WON74141.1 hypothetical protein R5L00_01235 [Nitrosospira sp. Is2]